MQLSNDNFIYFSLYVTAIYYVTTTITTVGYGDIFGVSQYEKMFIITLQFVGILTFTTI